MDIVSPVSTTLVPQPVRLTFTRGTYGQHRGANDHTTQQTVAVTKRLLAADTSTVATRCFSLATTTTLSCGFDDHNDTGMYRHGVDDYGHGLWWHRVVDNEVLVLIGDGLVVLDSPIV